MKQPLQLKENRMIYAWLDQIVYWTNEAEELLQGKGKDDVLRDPNTYTQLVLYAEAISKAARRILLDNPTFLDASLCRAFSEAVSWSDTLEKRPARSNRTFDSIRQTILPLGIRSAFIVLQRSRPEFPSGT